MNKLMNIVNTFIFQQISPAAAPFNFHHIPPLPPFNVLSSIVEIFEHGIFQQSNKFKSAV